MNNVIKAIPYVIVTLVACAGGYLAGRRSKSSHSREFPPVTPDSVSAPEEMDADMHPPPPPSSSSYRDWGRGARVDEEIPSEINWGKVGACAGVAGIVLSLLLFIIDKTCF